MATTKWFQALALGEVAKNGVDSWQFNNVGLSDVLIIMVHPWGFHTGGGGAEGGPGGPIPHRELEVLDVHPARTVDGDNKVFFKVRNLGTDRTPYEILLAVITA